MARYSSKGYGANEIGNEDDFGKLFKDPATAAYCGKYYGANDSEITSMGVELLYKDPVGFAKKDPEFFRFIVGQLRGSL